MIKKLIVVLSFFFVFLHLTYVNAEDYKYVEIFDTKQNKVVKVVQLNQKIQNMVADLITSKQEALGKSDPTTDDGYSVKVPLDPAVKAKLKYLNGDVSEVYIIIPEDDPPFYLISENENKLLCYTFNGSIDMLSDSLDFKLNNK